MEPPSQLRVLRPLVVGGRRVEGVVLVERTEVSALWRDKVRAWAAKSGATCVVVQS